ncbi:esterase B1-like [Schistocerca piceifrons]|uniref:esterase B1-like n=1 Tax=Schistocerca piceifrons TaxID=274613 RepID=UPI001F5EB579|nr:esterase B1-like [Schistocerca piceifrons]
MRHPCPDACEDGDIATIVRGLRNMGGVGTWNGPYPVMVYIHGGAFTSGFSFNDTPHYFVEKGVMLVATTYRLGALGFLSLQNDDIPGNAGLKDQVLALQWVQSNIATFGGDPSRVATLGETQGLFSEVMMQSGVATTPWALTDNPHETAYRMAEALGFQAQGDNHTDDDGVRLAAFFRAATYSDLINDVSIAVSDIENRCPLSLAFVSVVDPPSDSAVIVQPLEDILRTGSYNQVPIIVGVTSAEGTIIPT